MIDYRWLEVHGEWIKVIGDTDLGLAFAERPLSLMTLNVPGKPMWGNMTPRGAPFCHFYVPDPEWLREHGATGDGSEYWTVVKSGIVYNHTFRIPAVWGLAIKTPRRLSEPF